MYKEIDIGNKNKIIFFRKYNFWKRILDTIKDKTESIDIVTYNFNFELQHGNSFYNELLSLSEKGIRIRLMYSPTGSEDKFCDDIFSNEILCVSVPNNHSKIFISDTLAFIGSANFSLHSDENYECGFLTEDIELIKKLQIELITKGIFSHAKTEIVAPPFVNDPLSLVQYAIKDLDQSIREINAPEYNREYVFFDYPLLIEIYKSIEHTNICAEPEWLLNSYYELQSYLQYISADGGSQYTDEEVSNLKCLFGNLKSELSVLKADILLFYKKYGKHSFID
jgi:hypothetical protein